MQKRAIGAIIAIGVIYKTRQMMLAAQKKQHEIARQFSQNEPQKSKSKNTINLMKLIRICLPSLLSKGGLLLISKCVLLFIHTHIIDNVYKLESACGRALVANNTTFLMKTFFKLSIIGGIASIINNLVTYINQEESICWQNNLFKYIHEKYFGNKTFYTNKVDQYISDDVAKFAHKTTSAITNTLKPIIDIVLLTKSLSFVISYKWQLLLFTYYFLLSNAIKIIRPNIGKMTTMENVMSNDFRAAHHNISLHSESIVMNDPPSGYVHNFNMNNKIQRLLQYMSLSSFQQFVQGTIEMYSSKYMSLMFALLICHLSLKFNNITDFMLATDYVIRAERLLKSISVAFSGLIGMNKQYSDVLAYASRVSHLIDIVNCKPNYKKHNIGECIKFDNVTFNTPDGMQLIKNFTLTISPGVSTIIMGPNGCGKSSILRVLAGLWPIESGSITTLGPSDLLYLAQNPYMFEGTLREQITYPKIFNKISDNDVRSIITTVGLEFAESNFDKKYDWNSLSGGEKQRLAFARIIYHKPKFAILDECTSAITQEGESILYKLCADLKITTLSIGHRQTLLQFHAQHVFLENGGTYSISTI